ncbi:MAG TPA: addiction module protein [Verrucomicrobiae bacterium]|jgi:putative addiction module component (TIGR02574 family)|nr:addiction module protein [Verrucomicrobiae bacterium]
MSVITEKICLDALSLPRDARAEIAHRLLTSLENEDFADDVSEAWQTEIKRRRQDFAEGRAKEVSADEALRRAEASIE